MNKSVRIFIFVLTILFLHSCNKDENESSIPSDTFKACFNITVLQPVKTIEIPIDVVGSMTVISCNINGKSARMIIDTACGTICVFENKLNKYGLEVIGELHGGYTAAGYQQNPALSTFNIDLPEGIMIEAINGAMLPEYPDNSLDGIIGNSILISLKAELNYEKSLLILKSPSQPSSQIFK